MWEKRQDDSAVRKALSRSYVDVTRNGIDHQDSTSRTIAPQG
jgi:hypothetical protein